MSINAADLDVSTLPTLTSLDPNDTIVAVRLGVVYAVPGTVLRNGTRPILVDVAADRTMTPEDAGFKVDPRGGTVTITLPPLRAAATREYPMVNAADPDASPRGSIVFVAQAGEFIVHPTLGKIASFTSTMPGDTFAFRAEVIPTATTATRVAWYITRT